MNREARGRIKRIQICLNEERKAKTRVAGVRRKAVVDDAAVRGERIAEEIDGSKPGEDGKSDHQGDIAVAHSGCEEGADAESADSTVRPENRRP